ncbi:MAG: YHS domain-containing protein [Burkholderiales bacterium]|nr:YHS domain-containing protein [Opitutaceae bacterium]
MKTILRYLFAALAFVLVAGGLRAEKPVYTTWGGLAIKGQDPVAYFVESKPVKGSADFTHDWNGAQWRFASAANRDAFAAAPEKYAPQFGGYCAWAVSQGYTAGIDPDAWKIVDGKLYLNYDLKVQKTWEKDIPGNIAKAEKSWPEILKK